MTIHTKESYFLHKAALILITVAAAILQTTVFFRLRLFGAIPDIMLGLTITVAAFYGKREGAIEGLFAGYLIDCLGSGGLALSPLLYFGCGYFAGVFFARVGSGTWLSYITALALAAFPRATVTLINLQFYKPDYPIDAAFSSVIVPEAASTIIFCSVVQLAVLLLMRRNRKKTNLV